MLSCVVDALERRDVGIIDIPGAFMQADMDELVHMRLEGKMAELLMQINRVRKICCIREWETGTIRRPQEEIIRNAPGGTTVLEKAIVTIDGMGI